jgi:hypothetical protein
LAYAHGAGYNATKQCFHGTRVEILDEIEQWAHSTEPNVPRVFWLNGAAGSGKSAIAHTTALRFHQRNELGSFLCFDRTYLAECCHEKVFSTMARDLADQYPEVKRSLANLIREKNWLRQTDPIQQWGNLLVKPSAHLPTDHSILLVIDALDESGGPQSRRHLLSILANRTFELPSNVRILLTSRPLDDILWALQSCVHIVSKAIDDIPEPSITHDIKSYIFERLASVDDLFLDDNRLCSLVNRSEGLFQWAFVACEFIQGSSSRLFSPEQRFQQLINSSASGAVPSLDELYNTILQEICPDNNEDDIQAFQSVMGQVLGLYEPLSLGALTAIRKQFHSGFDVYDINSVLKHMGSVLSGITNHLMPIRPIHSSFHDYLTDPERSKKFYIDLSLHRNDLAFATLQVMKAELKFNICKLESSYLLNSDVFNLAQKIEQSISSPLSYSCQYWASHVQATSFHSKIATQIREFLNEQFLYWIEVLSLKKSVQIAAHSISLIISWVAVCLYFYYN